MTKARVRSTVMAYGKAQSGSIDAAALDVQVERAWSVVKLLRVENAAVVLDDPVGTGKTVVALAAVKHLLDCEVVQRVLVVAPSRAIADRWEQRAEDAGLTCSSSLVGAAGVIVCRSFRQLDAAQFPVPTDRSGLAVVVDEAHRGLHNPDGTERGRVRRVARGARVLLVTATPWQMSATGLHSMLSVGRPDGDSSLEPIRELGAAAANLVKARHAHDGLDDEPSVPLDQAIKTYQRLQASTQSTRRHVFLPAYDRSRAGLPDRFPVPPASTVNPAPTWELGFHVARLVPELTNTSDGTRVRNTDNFMRMLVSSNAARQGSTAWKSLASDRTKTAVALRRQLGAHLIEHPKVAFTAERAARSVQAERHVLVFCYYRETPQEIRAALEALGLDRVHLAFTPAQAQRACRAGFQDEVSSQNRPIVLIVGDALTESIDLDGGHPVVIHHDLTWSSTDYDQRLGRICRISTGFQPIAENDIVIPVLGQRDQRMYDTLKGRRDLALLGVGSLT